MKFNRILIISILIVIFTVGAVNACEDANTTDDILSGGHVEDVFADSDEEDDDGEYEIEFPDCEVTSKEDAIEVDIGEGEKGDLTVNINGASVNLRKSVEYDSDLEDNITYVYLNQSGDKTLHLTDADDDMFSIVLSTLNPGTYNINVIFKTPSKTHSHSSEVTVDTFLPEEEVKIYSDDVYIYNSRNLIEIDASDKFMDDLDIKINGVSYPSVKRDGQRIVDISNLNVGQYKIVVRYNNGKNSTSADFEVVQGISYPDDEIEYGSPCYVTLKLDNSAKGNLVVKIDNTEIGNVGLVNGEAKVLIPSLSVGTHTISAEYTGSDFDIEDIEDEEFEVIPKITGPSEMNAGENAYIIMEVGDTTGEFIVETEEKIYARVNINGKAKINLAGLDDEDYCLTVNFLGSDGTDWHEFYDISIHSVPARIVGAKDITMIYSSPTVYKLTVYGTNSRLAEYEEAIEFKIGNQEYDACIGYKGVVTFKIPNIAPGKYYITAIYEGVSVKSKLVINHLLKLNKFNVKKSAKTLVIKASLKKLNGKYLKNKKIILKFNGKKYTARTKNNGVAKFVIKGKVLKKLKVGKNITFKATYLKDTVKKTVKVKK